MRRVLALTLAFAAWMVICAAISTWLTFVVWRSERDRSDASLQNAVVR
jgi:hypothetical protein